MKGIDDVVKEAFEIKFFLSLGISLTEQGFCDSDRRYIFNLKYLFNPIIYMYNLFKKNKLKLNERCIEIGGVGGLDSELADMLKYISKKENEKARR